MRLLTQIALPFLGFVVLGSMALVGWMQWNADQESRTVFGALAKTNAAFIRHSRLPKTERVADSLGTVLRMRMFFRQKNGTIIPGLDPMPAGDKARIDLMKEEDGVVRLGNGIEAIASPLDEDSTMILVRPAETASSWLKPNTVFVLLTFWGISLGLAWLIARGVVHPIRQIAHRLPQIENDLEQSLPGAERQDEIGQLARAYLETRTQLAEERERREKAERMAILGKMATGLAHEIHNPVAAIQLHAQMLESATESEWATLRAESIPVLLSELRRIEGLVNQWMFLARPAPPQRMRSDLVKLVRQVVTSHVAMAKHAGVELHVDLPDELSTEMDSRRIAQAISNVIVNAIQAVHGKGTVNIHGSANGVICLRIEDSGPGFSPEALERYAEVFFSQKEGGMGIGLTVTTEILRAHGGDVRISNIPNGGAAVTLILPATNS